MDKNILFSIIIPVYNPNNTFFQLLDLLLELKHIHTLEIIVIDDGSEKVDMFEIDRYIKKGIIYKRFENRGVSVARNRGIALAHGDYLTFFDADDLIDVKAMNNVMNSIISSALNYDIYMYAYSVIKEQNCENMIPCLSTGLHSKSDLNSLKRNLIDVKFSKHYTYSYMGGKVYQYIVKRSLFVEGGLCFYENQKFAEDLCYCMKLFDLADSIFVFHDLAYLYYFNEGSASHRYRERLWEEWYSVYRYIDPYITDIVLKNRLIYWAVKYSIRYILSHEKEKSISEANVSSILHNIDFQVAMENLHYGCWTLDEKIENQLLKWGNSHLLICYERLIIKAKAYRKFLKERI